MTATEVREALREAAGALEVPHCDDVAFRRAVRAERSRRNRRRAVVAGGLAAAVVAVAGVAVPLLGSTGSGGAPAGTGTVAEARVFDPVYLVQDGRLVALDPQGIRHDLGVTSEGIVGWTAEGVLALDDDSHVVSFAADSGGEGPDGSWSFARAASPIEGTVTSVRLSGDGRWLAWTDLRGTLTVSDLKAGTRRTEDVGRSTSVAAVSVTGVLLTVRGPRYVLDSEEGRADVPVPDAAINGASSGQRGTVSVPDQHGRTSLFQVEDGSRVRRLTTVTGVGTLAPDGHSMAVVRLAGNDRESVSVWTPSGTHPLPDVHGVGLDVRWQDERTLLVSDGLRLWACDTVDRSCGVLPTGATEGRAAINLRP
jgi:hypothetical protein